LVATGVEPGPTNNVAEISRAIADHDIWNSWRRRRCRPTHIRNSGRISLVYPTTKKQKIPQRILSQMKSHEDELDSLLDLPCASEAATRERLLAIVSYLSLIQEK
jgi:hypothetical protein